MCIRHGVQTSISTKGHILYENNKKKQYLHQNGKSPTKKVMGWAIPSYITTKSHYVACNM